MDKIRKELQKLSAKEREKTKEILKSLKEKETKGLDIKKLKGRDDIFRVRKGTIRIIYRLFKGSLFILAIERRNDKTYK